MLFGYLKQSNHPSNSTNSTKM